MATDIIKRRVDVYPASWEQRKQWQEEAKKRGLPLTKFIILAIEEAINDSIVDNKNLVGELQQTVINQTADIKEKDREISRFKKLIAMQDEELEEFRNKEFLEKSFTGMRDYNQNLISALRSSSTPLSDIELLHKIGVSSTSPASVKAISEQLQTLSDIKLVQYTKDGWRWIR